MKKFIFSCLALLFLTSCNSSPLSPTETGSTLSTQTTTKTETTTKVQQQTDVVDDEDDTTTSQKETNQKTNTRQQKSTTDTNIGYYTDFSEPSSDWLEDHTPTEDNGNGVYGVENGRYWMATTVKEGGIHAFLRQYIDEILGDTENFSIETKFKMVPSEITSSSIDTDIGGGLVWGWKKYDDNNADISIFQIYDNGKFSIFRTPTGDRNARASKIYARPQESTAIHPMGQDNVMRVDYIDGEAHFYINDTLVHTAPVDRPNDV